MIASGFISFQMRAREAALFYERVLNTIDARLEQEQLSDAVLKRSDPKATSGFVAPLPAYVSRKHREKFLQGEGVRHIPTSTQLASTAVGPAVDATPELNSGLAAPSTSSIPSMQAIQIAAQSLAMVATRTGLRALNWVRGMKRQTLIRMAVIMGALLLAWGAWGFYGYWNRTPSSSEVRAAVEHTVNTPSQKLVDLSTKVVSDSGGHTATLQFSATLETVESLYTQVGVSRYLSEIGRRCGRVRPHQTGSLRPRRRLDSQ